MWASDWLEHCLRPDALHHRPSAQVRSSWASSCTVSRCAGSAPRDETRHEIQGETRQSSTTTTTTIYHHLRPAARFSTSPSAHPYQPSPNNLDIVVTVAVVVIVHSPVRCDHPQPTPRSPDSPIVPRSVIGASASTGQHPPHRTAPHRTSLDSTYCSVRVGGFIPSRHVRTPIVYCRSASHRRRLRQHPHPPPPPFNVTSPSTTTPPLADCIALLSTSLVNCPYTAVAKPLEYPLRHFSRRESFVAE